MMNIWQKLIMITDFFNKLSLERKTTQKILIAILLALDVSPDEEKIIDKWIAEQEYGQELNIFPDETLSAYRKGLQKKKGKKEEKNDGGIIWIRRLKRLKRFPGTTGE